MTEIDEAVVVNRKLSGKAHSNINGAIRLAERRLGQTQKAGLHLLRNCSTDKPTRQARAESNETQFPDFLFEWPCSHKPRDFFHARPS